MSTLNLRKVTEGQQRLISFRLSDLPANIRESGVETILRAELKVGSAWDAYERISEITHAALYPSDRVYWVSVEAFERVMNRKSMPHARMFHDAEAA